MGGLRTYVLLVLVAAVCILTFKLKKTTEDKDRYQSNYAAATSEIRRYKTEDNRNVAYVRTQTKTLAELKMENQQLVGELRSMQIKLRDVESVGAVSSQLEQTAVLTPVVVPDTTAGNKIDTSTYLLPLIETKQYRDEWTNIKLVGDTITFRVVDSLTVVQYAKKRRFLFWTWNKFSGEVAVTNKNPNVTITNVQTINITR